MKRSRQGFLERDHTADIELIVWGPDMPALLEQAARGMYKMAGLRLKTGERTAHELELRAIDRESLLVDFLDELLYLLDMEGSGFDTFDIELEGDRLSARLGGAPVEAQSKDIKAVTYHNMAVRETEEGLEVTVVFDV